MIKLILNYTTLILLVGCTLLNVEAAANSIQKVSDSGRNTDVTHVVVTVKGRVGIKRKNSHRYVRATPGMVISRGDQIRRKKSSKITLLSTDLNNIRDVPAGIQKVNYPIAKPILYSGRKKIIRPRGNGLSVVISPRRTRLINARPKIQWETINNSTSYTIILKSEGGKEWRFSTDSSANGETIYPNNWPSLELGKIYLINIVSDKGDSVNEPDLGFSLLDSSEAMSVRAAEARIQTLNLGYAKKRYLIAQLYADHGLNAEAIDYLEALTRSTNEMKSASMLMLGDLYLTVGLSRLAERAYLNALKLKRMEGDLEGQAATQYGLAQAYDEIGNRDEQIKWLSKAKSLYQYLEDRTKVKEIQEALSKLTSR
jgi:hypothetical protein